MNNRLLASPKYRLRSIREQDAPRVSAGGARPRPSFLLAVGLAASPLLAPPAVRGEEAPRPFLAFSAGQYNIADQKNAAAEAGLQWRGAGRLFVLQPIVGVALTHQGALDVYAGFAFDVGAGPLVLRPSFAPSAYRRGGGKDLGKVLEFRSGIEIGWRFDQGVRLGIELYHLSNASLGERNPGENSLLVTLAIPLRPPRP
jgi:lipid A 3-O-deacylase